MLSKRIFCTALLIVLITALTGCLPAPGSKSRRVSTGNDLNSTDAGTKAYLNLAAALLLQNEYTMALKELEKAQKTDPVNVDLENYFGLAYYGLAEYDLAEASFTKALEMRSARADIRNNLGLTYLAKKQYDKALAEFTTSSNDLSYQKKYLPMTNIGLTYLEMGRYDEALSALEKSIKTAPDYAKAYQLTGRVYLAKGQPNDALDYLNNAARLNPGDTDTYMSLGETFTSLGRIHEAAEAYGRVANLNPNTPTAMEAQKKARRLMGFE